MKTIKEQYLAKIQFVCRSTIAWKCCKM